MITTNLVQGSAEWLAARANTRNASEAPAMMDASSYMTRTELLRQKKTLLVKDVSDWKQKNLYDKGHEIEALAREIAEGIIGEELYPVSGTTNDGYLSASFDGLTMDGVIVWENKSWNKEKVAGVRAGRIPKSDYWQVIHQFAVSGAEDLLYMVTDGTEENTACLWVKRDLEAEAKLIAGWKQFDADLAAYEPEPIKAEVVAASVETLPAVVYQIDRTSMALTSNVRDYRAAAEMLVERSKEPLVTDQDFADREALCKAFGEAEKVLKMKAEEVVGQIQDVATFSRELGDIAEMFRAARLASEKLVKAEKENRKLEIQRRVEQAMQKYIDGINQRIAPMQIPNVRYDFAAPMKGKKNLTSMQDAVDCELARLKIETSAIADGIQENMTAFEKEAADYRFLFADLQSLVTRNKSEFMALVESRIITHKANEEKLIEAEVKAKADREEQAAKAKAEAEEQTKAEHEEVSQSAVTTTSTSAAQPAPSTPAPTAAPVSYTANKSRTSGWEMVQMLAQHYRQHESVIVQRLLDDMPEINAELEKEFA